MSIRNGLKKFWQNVKWFFYDLVTLHADDLFGDKDNLHEDSVPAPKENGFPDPCDDYVIIVRRYRIDNSWNDNLPKKDGDD